MSKKVVGCLLVAALMAVGCGGKKSESESQAAAAPAPAAQQPAGSQAGGSGSIPLVDSRGNPVPGMPSATGTTQQAEGLVWTAPSGWTEEPPSSSMRKAQYSVPAAAGDSEPGQCAVFYFGAGQGGDIKGNVDRWAAQFADAAGNHPTPQISEGRVSGLKVMRVSTQGTYTAGAMSGGDPTPKPDQMLLGAIVEGAESNWFFKCTGPKKTMEANRAAFESLVGSIHPN
ncbi:MAG TPA: hypothetical protein VFW45_03445 [Candidatus Polarisedimenticolia bacterium]|nr:hypothetical protein [Candidatus Polarisedimenticolia bacterium]